MQKNRPAKSPRRLLFAGAFSLAIACMGLASPAWAAASIMFMVLPAGGTYTVGQQLEFAVMFDDTMVVTGTPALELTIGGQTVQARYSHGSGTQDLYFRYQVAAGDQDTDGIVVNRLVTGSGTLLGGGLPVDLTLPPQPSPTGIMVDGGVAAVAVPTLTEWAMLILTGLLALFGLQQLSGRRARGA